MNSAIKYIWAMSWENVSSGICRQRSPRSDCTSVQSDQGLLCPQTKSLNIIECLDGEDRMGL